MRHSVTKKLTGILAVLLVVSIFCSVVTACTPSNAADAMNLASPAYPEPVAAPGEGASDKEFDTWQAYNEEREKAAEGNLKAMKPFYKKTLAQVLGQSKAATEDTDKNALYSPLNVYLALAMLTETTDGDSRAQLLSLLGEKDLAALRKRVKKLFTANYQDDGSCTSLLANSLWLNETLSFNQETLDKLAKYHYASAFSGQPGTEKMNKALQAWINENTHDLLKDQAESLTLDPATVMALVSTIYFKAAWAEQFEEANTKKQTFYAPSGEVEVDMMHRTESMAYYTGTNFEAVALPLVNSGYMWFFLPKKDGKAGALPADKQVLNLLADPASYKNFSYPQVTLSLPKMDAVSDTDLIKDLKKLGVTDIFNAGKANFSPLMKDAKDIEVSEVKHAARVKTDEEGVEAAAFTAIVLSKAAMPTDFVNFTVDRPYYFAITGYTGDLLFAGLVNNPVAK